MEMKLEVVVVPVSDVDVAKGFYYETARGSSRADPSKTSREPHPSLGG